MDNLQRQKWNQEAGEGYDRLRELEEERKI